MLLDVVVVAATILSYIALGAFCIIVFAAGVRIFIMALDVIFDD